MKAKLTPPAVLYNENYAKKTAYFNYFNVDDYQIVAQKSKRVYKATGKTSWVYTDYVDELESALRAVFAGRFSKLVKRPLLKYVEVWFNDKGDNSEFVEEMNTIIGNPLQYYYVDYDRDQNVAVDSNGNEYDVYLPGNLPKNQPKDEIEPIVIDIEKIKEKMAAKTNRESKDEDGDEDGDEEILSKIKSFFENNKKIVIAASALFAIIILVLAIKK